MNYIKINYIYSAVLALLYCAAIVNSQIKAKYIICADSGENCEQFEQEPDVKCDNLSNKFDCLVNNSELTSFARVNYEESLNSNFSNSLYVIADIRPPNGKSSNAEIEIVVVVKDPNIKGFKDLKDSNVCYPGFKDANQARYFSNNFENTILNSISPELCLITNYPYIGRHIKGLNDFFNSSCRPGPWVNHAEIDSSLKHTYTKLCRLCNISADYGCSTLHVDNAFEYSLDCFQNKGNVAILTKELALTLKSPLYLTANGTVSLEPYVWFEKPWPLLLSNRQNPDRILTLTLENESMAALSKSQTLRNFMTNSINKSPVNQMCHPKLNWCTNSNLESEECELLREVVSQQRIPVDIECIEKIDKLACINSVSQNETDILTAQNIYGYIARSKLLEPIAYPAVTEADASKSMVVILSEDSPIKKFQDLKGNFGCFSQFGDNAFNSLVFELRRQNIIEKSCILDHLMSFLGMSCIPGIIDPNCEALVNNVDISKFCKCAGGPTSKTDVQCSASYENEYYGNEGALKCLNEIGKYAVVSNYEIEDRLKDSKYSILCKNNVIKHFSEINKEDDDCFLSITTNQEIMIRKHDSIYIDALAMLADLDGLPKQYGFFNHLKNIIFKNSIPKLYFNTTEDKFVAKYKELFSAYDTCVEEVYTTNSAIQIHPFYMLTITILFIISNL